MQMVLQLAYFRIYKQPCATYESASTRQFLHGRTECIRSCSTESVAFTKAFDQSDITVPCLNFIIEMTFQDEKKRELMLNSVNSHIQYSIKASSGLGVDRHLLGLRCMQQSGELADIFKDPAYLKSMNFRLSSSNVSPGDRLYGGFGPVVPGATITRI